jgi:hypothetical protein
MAFQVAIIGSPGSGKTVLTAVLSRYLSGHHDRIYMNPKGACEYIGNDTKQISTFSYISRTMEALHVGNWAGRTEGANKCELGFELHIDGNVYEMKLLDSAGEDLQKIGQTYDETELNPFQKKLLKYIESSNVVVIIVNLDHFAGAPTQARRDANENVIKEMVDKLVKAKTCHYILVCFTAYDKHKATITQTYGNNNFNGYLRGELPMFYRSCEVATNTVVRDYGDYGQKRIVVESVPVAPVIEQRPDPKISSDRYGKPPIGFDVRNKQHSQGIPYMADWLYKCEQEERRWSDVEDDIKRGKKWEKILSYRVAPIVIGAACGLLALVLLSSTLIVSLIFGMPIGAGIGFLAGDKLKVIFTKRDGLVFKYIRGDEDDYEEYEEQEEEQETPRPKYTGGTSTAPRPSGAGGTSSAPRPSRTSGTGATAGEETMD